MIGEGSEKTPARLTSRGAVTRGHIVEVAANLMYSQGVAATTLDQITEVGEISKSQLYHYFPNRDLLIAAVIRLQTTRVFSLQEPHLEQLDSLAGLVQWRDAILRAYMAGRNEHGCLIGTFANELASRSESARLLLSAAMQTWQANLASGFARMRARGELLEEADPEVLAAGVIAALEGGYLLAHTARDAGPLVLALDMALGYVESNALAKQPPHHQQGYDPVGPAAAGGR